jgi:site-specific recombinase XerD
MTEPTTAPGSQNRLSELAPEYLMYAQVELGLAAQSIVKYRDCLRHVGRMIGDLPPQSYSKQHLLQLKQAMLSRGHGVSRQVGILAALKSFLRYCRDERGLAVLSPELITFPKRPRRDVQYLTTDEVARFVGVMKLVTSNGAVCVSTLRFRALVELLLGSAMRIGEALSLDRGQIDFDRREAKIVGKGNKQRTVFFTDRAIDWLRSYLEFRHDDHEALFVSRGGASRLSRDDIWRPFARYRQTAGIAKKITPHILRHTAATQLLFNGCPVGHIKEILGHERLETTCRYYLGLDKRAAKLAHREYLHYYDNPGLKNRVKQQTRPADVDGF